MPKAHKDDELHHDELFDGFVRIEEFLGGRVEDGQGIEGPRVRDVVNHLAKWELKLDEGAGPGMVTELRDGQCAKPTWMYTKPYSRLQSSL